MSDSNDSKNQCPIILFAAPHLLHELRAIKVFVTNGKVDVGRMQPQVVKCREFIFTEAEVIGTPSPDINESSFYLIAHTTLMETGKLQNRLSRVGLRTTKSYEVTSELYQSCLRYTIQSRLSPSWNKVGELLIQGRDFLTHKGCANAVKMDITVVKDELYFTLSASIVKLAPLHVTDLDITPKSLEHFVSKKSSEINYDQIYSNWCFVLPSMKRGHIMSISHTIPEESPFKTYRDLKRHWKNMYGYRLPEHEEDVHFYQIRFGPFGGNLFTYPGVCLRGKELHKMPRIDQKPILRTFIQDLQTRIPTVCGCTLKLQSKAKFAIVTLCPGNKVSTANQSNLTSKLAGARPSLYRTKSELEKMFANEQNSTNTTNNSMNKDNDSQAPRKAINLPVKSLSNKTVSVTTTSQQGMEMKLNFAAGSSSAIVAPKPTSTASVATPADKYIPKFVPQFHSINKRAHNDSMKTTVNKFIPQKDSLISNNKQDETKKNLMMPVFCSAKPSASITNTKSATMVSNVNQQQKTSTVSKSKPVKRVAEKTKEQKEKAKDSKRMKKMMKAES